MIIATQVFFGSRIFAYLRNCDVNMKNMKIFSLEIGKIRLFLWPWKSELSILFTIIYRKNSILKNSWCLRFLQIKNGCQSDSSIKFQKGNVKNEIESSILLHHDSFRGFLSCLKKPRKILWSLQEYNKIEFYSVANQSELPLENRTKGSHNGTFVR